VLTSFLTGAIAGYGIAIPVGAIAVLIIDLGIRRGFRMGAAAGLGAATADALYAALAVVAGTALAVALEPWSPYLKVVAVVALVAIATIGVRRAVLRARGSEATPTSVVPREAGRTYLRFLGLTLLNPHTILYFGALILGRPEAGAGPAERTAFVVGAALASASWQLLLAGLGALAHKRLPPRAQLAISLVGNLVVVGFALVIASSI
jgi:arginine exporter protein ArgO